MTVEQTTDRAAAEAAGDGWAVDQTAINGSVASDPATDERLVRVSDEQLPFTSVLESLLFVAESPIEPAQLARVLEASAAEIEAGLQRLDTLYQTHRRGLRIQQRNGKYMLVTIPAAAPVIEAFLNLDLQTKLSGPALEALSIIAYRQPITRAQIEAVRGVDCGGVLRTLLHHELIEEVGRLDTAGRPILYSVTDHFMHHFGLTDMQELPALDTIDVDALYAATELAADDLPTDPSGEPPDADDGPGGNAAGHGQNGRPRFTADD